MSRLSRAEIARAAARLSSEETKPVAELCHLILSGVSPANAVRYIFRGRAGFHLDGVRKGGEWHTSEQACARFNAQLKSIGARTD
jgi:hypothetical protein